MNKFYTVFLLGILMANTPFAQDNVGIGTTTPHPQAILELVSSNQGFLMSRMNAADTSIAGMNQQGMMFFAQDVQAFLFYDGTSWQSISTGVNYWGENGTDIFNLNTGGVGIGTNSTALMLQVTHNLAGSNPVVAIENENTSGDVSYGFLNSGSATSYTMGIDGSDANKFKISNNPSLGSNDRIVINSSGDVGIGTSIPDEALTIGTPIGWGWVIPAITVGNASGGAIDLGNSTNHLSIEHGSIFNRARIRSTDVGGIGQGDIEFVVGGIGINTSTPQNDLDVSGGVAIGAGYAGSQTAFTNGMVIEGDVGIGAISQVGAARLTISEATTGYTGMTINASTNGDPFYGYSENNLINSWTYLDGGLDTWRLYHYGEQISVTSGGKVGIGEFTAINDLDIDGNLAVGATYSGVSAAPTNGAIIEGQMGVGINTVNSAYKVHLRAESGGSQNYTLIAQNDYDGGNAYGLLSWMTGSGTGTHYGLFLNNGSATTGTEYGIYSTGEDMNYLQNDLGIGTTIPVNRLDVEGAVAIGTSYSGTSTAPANGLIVQGNVGIGASSVSTAYKLFVNTGFGSTERFGVISQADYDGASSAYGFYSFMTGAGSGTHYGIYLSNGSATSGNEYGVYSTGEDYNYFSGNVGLGVTVPTARLQVVTGGDVNFGDTSPQGNLNVGGDGNSTQGVIVVNRTGSDGNLIRFRRDGSTQGIISVSGGLVTYGAFTGSHYGWSKKKYEKGILVSFTGKNENMEDNPDQEIVYGIEATSKANSSNVLGAFLGKQESIPDHDLDNPYLIMAVGNGEIWVVDNGKDLVPGDYLMTSGVKGHAMADLGQFEIANIVARVAEPVNWSKVKETIDGKKHKLISVTFETLVINHKAEKLESELIEIRRDLDDIKSQLSIQASSKD